MDQSIETTNIFKALCIFQSVCPVITANETADLDKYAFKYATQENILTTIQPFLHECGLSVVQMTEHDTAVTTQIMHNSGEWIRSTLLIPTPPKKKENKNDRGVWDVFDPEARDYGISISYACRYALIASLRLIIEEKKTAKNDRGREWLNDTNTIETAVKRAENGETGLIAELEQTYRLNTATKDRLKKAEEKGKAARSKTLSDITSIENALTFYHTVEDIKREWNKLPEAQKQNKDIVKAYALRTIKVCKDVGALQIVWNESPELQPLQWFIYAINAKKTELGVPSKKKANA